MGWTDAHCHLQEQFVREGQEASSHAATALRAAAQADVELVVCVGTDLATSTQAVELAAAAAAGDLGPGLPEVAAVVGLHPHEAEQELAPVAELLRSRREAICAVGECGLDYHYDHAERGAQRQALAAQVGLAHELDLALVIHVREAFEDLFAILASEGVPRRSVVHCFTGGPAEAEAALAMGLYLSFSGVVTFKNAEELREAVRITPAGRFTVETDAPFLAPVPHRGKANLPQYVPIVGEFIAQLRGQEAGTIAADTTATARSLFGLTRVS